MTCDLTVTTRRSPNLQYCDFEVEEGVISNGYFETIRRDWPKPHMSRNPAVGMDCETKRLIDRLFMSPAVARLSLSPQKLSVMIGHRFYWSELEPWVNACIAARQGLPFVDPGHKVLRHDIFVKTALCKDAGLQFEVSGLVSHQHNQFLLDWEDFIRRGRNLEASHGQRFDHRSWNLLSMLFEESYVGAVKIGHTSLAVKTNSVEMLKTAKVNVVKILKQHMGWQNCSVRSETYLTYNDFLHTSNHPNDSRLFPSVH